MKYILLLMFFGLTLETMHQSHEERKKQLKTPLLAKGSLHPNDTPSQLITSEYHIILGELIESHRAGKLFEQEDEYTKALQLEHKVPMTDILKLLRLIREEEFEIFSPRKSEKTSSFDLFEHKP